MQTLAQFLKPEVLVLLAVIIGLIVLAAKGKLPTVNSFVAFCNAINTRGGNIVLLTVMVFLFVTTSMKYVLAVTYKLAVDALGSVTSDLKGFLNCRKCSKVLQLAEIGRAHV